MIKIRTLKYTQMIKKITNIKQINQDRMSTSIIKFKIDLKQIKTLTKELTATQLINRLKTPY